MPKNFVHARNANGRVAMGLHGYRIGIGEYGRVGRLGMPPPFLGWTPRHQWGFHLRRVGGQLFYPGPPIVPERWDGRMKPGELQSGGYGFYYKYKDGQPIQSARQTDVLQDLQTVITPMVSRPRSTEPARTYKELIASPVYFSNEKWQECLASHGLIVDKEARTLTVQSEKVAADLVYDLTEEETAVLTSNSIEEQPVEKRLEVLNGVIKADFADKVTMADLDSERPRPAPRSTGGTDATSATGAGNSLPAGNPTPAGDAVWRNRFRRWTGYFRARRAQGLVPGRTARQGGRGRRNSRTPIPHRG